MFSRRVANPLEFVFNSIWLISDYIFGLQELLKNCEKIDILLDFIMMKYVCNQKYTNIFC